MHGEEAESVEEGKQKEDYCESLNFFFRYLVVMYRNVTDL